MRAQTQGLWPFCGQQVPRVQVQPGQEGCGAGHSTSSLIQEERPHWIEEDGACRGCWESLVAIRCVIRFFKQFRNNQRLVEHPTPRFGYRAVTNVLWLDLERYSIPIRRSVANPCAR
jgi:hypothetical protein